MRVSSAFSSILLLVSVSQIVSTAESAGDSFNKTRPLRDGEVLVSESGFYVLGFFSPGSSGKRYLGIWYNFSVDKVVWVANRHAAIEDSSGVLNLTSGGDLLLVRNRTPTPSNSTASRDEDGAFVVWSTSSSTTRGGRWNGVINNPTARLLDSGNLVVVASDEESDDRLLWQSFDHVTDTYLQGMKLGIDRKYGSKWHMTSWNSEDDPSVGGFASMVGSTGSEEAYLVRIDGTTKVYRYGTWNGRYMNGMPQMVAYSKDFKLFYVSNSTEISLRYETVTDGMFSEIRLNPDGKVTRSAWTVGDPRWTTYWTSQMDDCDSYAKCGPNGVCNIQDPELCRCYRGFTPTEPTSWNKRDFSRGCVRKESLRESCSRGEDRFFPVNGVKLPDASEALVDGSTIRLEDCRNRCSGNCSCVAYAALRLDGISPRGCIMWSGDLVDTKIFANGEQDLFLRLRRSELPDGPSEKRKKVISIAVGVTMSLLALSLCGAWFWFRWWKRKRLGDDVDGGNIMNKYTRDGGKRWKDDLLLLDFGTIAAVTSSFSNANVIGRGGFGTVYKGRMADGQEVAVKRLSRGGSSGPGGDDFLNEVSLIAKLQHRNLVSLLGCCMERDERILVYEFMPNKSLDSALFGEKGRRGRERLGWRQRVEIITGIARGLLYLHQDSRLRIIHRDLKAGNVLLDEAMNPKICDFGTARLLFGADQMEDKTRRVVGTYGYMSPEYAMNGIFSTKSDVFSFGVLLLEIVSGKKNNAHHEDLGSLLEMAWKLWMEGKSLELVDEAVLLDSAPPLFEVMRLVQIGLLCVQKLPTDRPAMSTVLFMLSSGEGSPLPEPKKPSFAKTVSNVASFSSSSEKRMCTINDLTLTAVQGR